MDSPRLPHSRLSSCLESFCRDEDGSATVWNLTWLAGFAIMGGVAIDSTNAWRHKTMLASTADVAALAGAWDLPRGYEDATYSTYDFSDVYSSALEFAAMNMDHDLYGDFIKTEDITVGHWNAADRSFIEGMDPVNAVRALTYQNTERANTVQTTLLRFIGFYDFKNIDGEAIAMLGIDECYLNGIIAREELFVRSNAKVGGDACLHGQLGVNVRPNALWADPERISTGASPEGTVGEWDIASNQYLMNPDGTQGDTIDMNEANTNNLYPPMVDQVVAIGQSALAGLEHYRHFTYPAQDQSVSYFTPPEIVVLPQNFSTVSGTSEGVSIVGASGSGGSTTTGINVAYHDTYTYGEVDQKGNSSNFDWPVDSSKLTLKPDGYFGPYLDKTSITTTTATLAPQTIYFADKCHDGTLLLTGTIKDVSILTNCKIDIGNGAIVENSFLLTSATGSQAIQISNNTRIGAKTSCESWGGVMMMSNGDIRATGNGNGTPPDQYDEDAGLSQYWGAILVARDDIHFAAKSDSEKGITMLAGGEINIAANAEIGALQLPIDESNEQEVENCKKGVGPTVDFFAYDVALVH